MYQQRLKFNKSHRARVIHAMAIWLVLTLCIAVQSIQINHEYLLQANWESNLGTVLHEFKHSYDHYVAELAPVDPANLQRTRYRMALKSDMDHYMPGTNGTYQDYYNQQVEKEARQYAQSRLVWYVGKLKIIGIEI